MKIGLVIGAVTAYVAGMLSACIAYDEEERGVPVDQRSSIAWFAIILWPIALGTQFALITMRTARLLRKSTKGD